MAQEGKKAAIAILLAVVSGIMLTGVERRRPYVVAASGSMLGGIVGTLLLEQIRGPRIAP